MCVLTSLNCYVVCRSHVDGITYGNIPLVKDSLQDINARSNVSDRVEFIRNVPERICNDYDELNYRSCENVQDVRLADNVYERRAPFLLVLAHRYNLRSTYTFHHASTQRFGALAKIATRSVMMSITNVLRMPLLINTLSSQVRGGVYTIQN